MTPAAFNKALGRVIRRHREARGLSQVAVGKALGVVYQQVQRYESGRNALDAHYVPKLAAFFGVSIADLYVAVSAKSAAPDPSPAENDAFLAAHYVRQMSEPVRRALIPYLQSIVYLKGKAA